MLNSENYSFWASALKPVTQARPVGQAPPQPRLMPCLGSRRPERARYGRQKADLKTSVWKFQGMM